MPVIDLQRALDAGQARAFDVAFARLIERLGEGGGGLAIAAYLLSRQANAGDVCIDLADHAERPYLKSTADVPTPRAPRLDDWLSELGSSPVVGVGADRKPLILDRTRLYLGRYWHYEQDLASALAARAARRTHLDETDLMPRLDRLFAITGEQTDWQRIATVIALAQDFSIISGGPGTGKTTTVARLLALSLELNPGPYRIGLAAPTGKAAARLTESLRRIRSELDCDPSIAGRLPQAAMTIHRLLGYSPHTSAFKHRRDNPLHLDLLVVDEASMIDLELAAKLVAALPAGCRFVLLGDKDQLASVEAGSVLGELCRDADPPRYSRDRLNLLQRLHPGPIDILPAQPPLIGDCVTILRKSYRFDDSSAIGRFAAAVKRGEATSAIGCLQVPGDESLVWIDGTQTGLQGYLWATAVEHYAAIFAAGDPAEALAAFERYRLLTAVREGSSGVAALNRIVEGHLARRGVVRNDLVWYPGRPVLVTQNDYDIGLFNGDTGIAWPDVDAGGRMRVFFVAPDGRLRGILPQRLPQHETAFAMTVHKSQGSEFERLGLVLPDRDSPILARELLYTAVTRARARVDLIASRQALARAIDTPTRRLSGLGEALWGEAVARGLPDAGA